MTVAMNNLDSINPATREFLQATHHNYINGHWHPAASGKTLAVQDPAISTLPWPRPARHSKTMAGAP